MEITIITCLRGEHGSKGEADEEDDQLPSVTTPEGEDERDGTCERGNYTHNCSSTSLTIFFLT